MKTHYEVQQELARLERLVPHIISDQSERAEEILSFHIAGLLHSAAPDQHPLIHTRTAALVQCCRAATDGTVATP
jgi:hypothetical protein